MKAKYLKLQHWLLVSLMGALGLSSCHGSRAVAGSDKPSGPELREREEMRLMYGVPTMNFRVSGRVVDPKGKPVKGVRVNVLDQGIEATADTVYGDPERVREYLEGSSVSTDSKGRFVVEGSGRPSGEVRVLVRDVEGGGELRNQLIELEVSPSDVDRTDAAGWNQGTFRKDIEIKLERR